MSFIPSKHQGRTTFELITLDRPGLIAKLAAILQQQNVTLLAAKITTIGEQAEDLFIVTSEDNTSLDEQQKQALKQQIIEDLEF